MIVKIKNELKFKNKSPIEIEKNNIQKTKIQETWEKVKKTKKVYNGDIYVITNLKLDSNETIFEIAKAKYADWIYAKENNDLIICPLFTGILFKTKDENYVFTKKSNNTLNLVGGMVDSLDFEDEIFIPEKCLGREIREEIGLDLKNKNQILNYKEEYIKIPMNQTESYPHGIIYTGTLNYTKSEFEKYFNENKKYFDEEVQEIAFYTKENYKNIKDKDKSVGYLMELMEKVL